MSVRLPDDLQSALGERYTIERELGRGGMAVVYLVRDRKHQRPVALKVLHAHLARALGAERFLREIEIAARLTHPHILPVYDSGEAGGLLYYLMPYIQGESLRERLTREGPLPLGEALRIAGEVADALAYAHAFGIIHRDIKPENILLSGSPLAGGWHATLADFGIARAVSESGGERLTETGFGLGTPAYMSPEQAAGEPEVDGRSDIYSLGCVLYEMLAGEPPFTAPTAQAIIIKHLTEPARPLRTLRSTVPQSAERAVSRALAKAPADRFQTASELALTLTGLLRADAGRGRAPGRAEAHTASIAVLPFVNRSSDPENEYFSDGLSEELINALTKLQGLRVASRTSAFAFKGRSEDVRRIGEQLNVATVLEGGVRKVGNRLRITAELVSTDDGYTLWSETYDREMQDVFAVQDEIVHAIVSTLKVKLVRGSGAALVDRATDNLDAYQLYLKGRYCWNKRTAEGMLQAIQYLRQAISMDQGYGEAYAGLAASYVLAGHFEHGVDRPHAAMPKSKEAALQALRLDPTLAEAYTALAFVRLFYDWHWGAAEDDFKRAIDLNPGYATAHHWYAMQLVSLGRAREGVAMVEHALELDPLSLPTMWGAGWVYHYAGQFERAAEYCRRVIEMDPHFIKARLQLGQSHTSLGRVGEAVTELERAARIAERNPRSLMPLGYAYAAAGDREAARGVLRELEEQSRQSYVFPDYIAAVHAGLGEADAAFEWLQRAYEERSSRLVVLNVDPMFAALRPDPRFRGMLDKVGL